MKLHALLPCRSSISRRRVPAALLLCAVLLLAPAAQATKEERLNEQQRERIIHAFLAESPFVHRALPRGKDGVRIASGQIKPSEAELRDDVMRFGAVAKPGDRVRITAVKFHHNGVMFEINGGPAKRRPWRERVQIGVNGVDPRAQQVDPSGQGYEENTGSSVFLELKDDATLTTEEIKDLLAPVLDFKAMTTAEAYQKSLPPKLADAIKHHRALVGMDHDMVQYALGRPPRRIRETLDGKEMEEWIYGDPPRDVQFIRFQGDRVVRIEQMTVTGQKIVRTDDEVGDLSGVLNASERRPAGGELDREEERRAAPSLLRPGEKSERPDPSNGVDRTRQLPPDTGSAPAPTNGPAGNGPQPF